MDALNALRNEVAAIDDKVVRLLCQRAVYDLSQSFSDVTNVSCEPNPSITQKLNDLLPDFSSKLFKAYFEKLLPAMRRVSVSDKWLLETKGESLDAQCLAILISRFYIAIEIAAVKFSSPEDLLINSIREHDLKTLNTLITYPEVERKVIERVSALPFELADVLNINKETATVFSKAIAVVYKDWLIPLSREIQVAWLLRYGCDSQAVK